MTMEQLIFFLKKDLFGQLSEIDCSRHARHRFRESGKEMAYILSLSKITYAEEVTTANLVALPSTPMLALFQ